MRGKTAKTLRVGLLGMVAAMGVVACQPVYEGPTNRPKVGIVGDSITAHADAHIQKALSKERRAVMAVPGIDLADGRKTLVQPMVASKPAILVIELGINSAREVWNSADLPHLEGILSDVKAVPCVIWVTHDALEPSYYDHLGPGTLNERITAFEASLAKRLPRHPHIRVADFGALATQHLDWYDTDRLHLTAAGQKGYAAFLSEQIAQGC